MYKMQVPILLFVAIFKNNRAKEENRLQAGVRTKLLDLPLKSQNRKDQSQKRIKKVVLVL